MEQFSDERAEEFNKDIKRLRTQILIYMSHQETLQTLKALISEGYTAKMSVSYGIESVMPKGDAGERVDPLDAYIDRKVRLEERIEKISEKMNVVDEMLNYAYITEGSERKLCIDEEDMQLIRHIMSGGSMRQFAFDKGWSPNKPQYRFKRAVQQIVYLRMVRTYQDEISEVAQK